MFSLGRDLDALLDRLHAQSAGQDESMRAYFAQRVREGTLSWKEFDERTEQFMSDKLVALDRDKAQFCYQLCRALKATRVVEIGTSFGVSTLYLAAAVRDNAGGADRAIVIGTEHEPVKARAARANFAEAGLTDFIDLREGDLRTTLSDLQGPVDFVLMDIWTDMARPAIERVAPQLRIGAVVICDNTTQFREQYRAYFDYVADPANGLRTVTLPFEGGLEFTLRG